MNLTITTEQEAIFATEAAERNKTLADGDAPHTAESIALLLIAKSANSYAATHEAAIRAALASNERLMALGVAVFEHPEKLDAIEDAVTTILSQ
jgi:hypothetical protein